MSDDTTDGTTRGGAEVHEDGAAEGSTGATGSAVSGDAPDDEDAADEGGPGGSETSAQVAGAQDTSQAEG